MSYPVSHPSYSQFAVIFDAALEEYAQKTGMALTTHPIAAALESCHSQEAILAVLQEQVFGRYQDKVWRIQLVRHLESIIDVLVGLFTGGVFAEGIGLVSTLSLRVLSNTLIYLPTESSTSEGDICWDWSPTRSAYLHPPHLYSVMIAQCSRRLREPLRAMMHLSNSLNVSNTTFVDSGDLQSPPWRERYW